jgi:hypothetical protein
VLFGEDAFPPRMSWRRKSAEGFAGDTRVIRRRGVADRLRRGVLRLAPPLVLASNPGFRCSATSARCAADQHRLSAWRDVFRAAGLPPSWASGERQGLFASSCAGADG